MCIYTKKIYTRCRNSEYWIAQQSYCLQAAYTKVACPLLDSAREKCDAVYFFGPCGYTAQCEKCNEREAILIRLQCLESLEKMTQQQARDMIALRELLREEDQEQEGLLKGLRWK